MSKLWTGQIRGSGICAAVFVAVVLAAWVWIRQTGALVPASFTAYLVWIYVLLTAVVAIALLMGVAVHVIYLRVRNSIETRSD